MLDHKQLISVLCLTALVTIWPMRPVTAFDGERLMLAQAPAAEEEAGEAPPAGKGAKQPSQKQIERQQKQQERQQQRGEQQQLNQQRRQEQQELRLQERQKKQQEQLQRAQEQRERAPEQKQEKSNDAQTTRQEQLQRAQEERKRAQEEKQRKAQELQKERQQQREEQLQRVQEERQRALEQKQLKAKELQQQRQEQLQRVQEERQRRIEEKQNKRNQPPPPADVAPGAGEAKVPPTADPVQDAPAADAQNRDKRQQNPSAFRRPPPEAIRRAYVTPPKQTKTFDEVKSNRRERELANGNLRVIEEPDRRVIVKQNNRTFIRHNESDRFERISRDARTIRRADGTSTTFLTRTGGVRVYNVTDRNGRLLYRYRRYPDGREVVLIDNRRYYRRERNRSRDILLGVGIGLAVGSVVALAAPRIDIPRERYIVDYDRASDDDIYEALSAPPVERLDRGYSLDEVRYTPYLRDRMRRIDLDTVTFDFGSWEVGPDQERALSRLADGIMRVLDRNPEEIFLIEGHTDAVGSEEDNLTLSDRRAQSVAEILTTAYGVPPENLVTQGYGEEQLKVPTSGPERTNRRIAARRIGPLLSGRLDDDRSGGGGYEGDRYSGARDDEPPLTDDPGFDDRSSGDRSDSGDSTYDYDRDRYDGR